MSGTIKTIEAREILDSRGLPTVEATVTLKSGAVGTASVPSGASTGSHEAIELRDGDRKRYRGKGVRRAVRNVNIVLHRLLRGRSAFDQSGIDRRMVERDGTRNKSRLGANAILGVSLAVSRAAAAAKRLSLYAWLRKTYATVAEDRRILKAPYRLPRPMMNVLNGGAHAPSGPDAQEFLILPRRSSFRENLRLGSEVFHALRSILLRLGLPTAVGDEGGFAVPFTRISDGLRLLNRAVKAAGFRPGRDVRFGLDVAASELYHPRAGVYAFRRERKTYSKSRLLAMYERLLRSFPLESLEDGFAEDDFAGWRDLTMRLGKKLTLVGDDLFVTNVSRIERGVRQGAANALLVKPNQIGTLTETFEAIVCARQHDMRIAVSHRSGETLDTTIADLAVAVNAEFLKSGSLSRGERLAKYNRLLAIENVLRAKR